MSLNKLTILFAALLLPFALMSCSDNTTGAEEEEEETTEVVYALSFTEGDGVATFFVDMTDIEGFDPATHKVYITGSLLNWTEPGTEPDRQEMVLIEDASTEIPVVTPEATGEVAYKYFSDFVAQGWDGGEWAGDPNRTATLTAGAEIQDIWGDQPE
ncbi:hypothetical protein [Rhodohalobacter mucosus]|uniref:Uncharacterized protein n=1 Tax=Rhodohalobacter mucosus TaxID=2079485 RepID=A0A316TPY0_9BACT|nr:hypothetical protein [Rhodohalobacter mucosus]PWN06683.1 hypothetical protein DDZ15_09210 [Rhodohalobacter mucosus]